MAVHAVYNIGQIRANQNIAVFGAGPVGLLCMAVAKACSASRIIAIDIAQHRLDFAKSYVATDAYQPSKMQEGESKMAYSKRSAHALAEEFGLDQRGVNSIDLVIDASGAEVCIQTGIYLIKNGGKSIR